MDICTGFGFFFRFGRLFSAFLRCCDLLYFFTLCLHSAGLFLCIFFIHAHCLISSVFFKCICFRCDS